MDQSDLIQEQKEIKKKKNTNAKVGMHLNAHYRGRDERSFAPSGPVSTKSFYSYFYVDYKAFFFI